MNQKTELESIAKNIIEKSGMPNENYGSVLLTLMFISIILTSIRVLQECHKDKDIRFYGSEVRKLGRTKGWFTRMKLKKIIKSQLKPTDYKKYKENIVSAILDVAENLTDEQMSTILKTEE